MSNTVRSVNISEIVQPMQRGQITIPVAIRRKLNITSETWLWVKLIKDKIVVEPVKQEKTQDLSGFLLEDADDTSSYWTDEDSRKLKKVKAQSKQRSKDLGADE